jgi:2'-5' RNA ligase
VGIDNLHITLKFLGDVEDHRAEEIAASLGEAVADVDAFDIALRGLGAFPTRVHPRVIWAGVGVGAPALAVMASAVERSLGPLGFPPEARGFSAHVPLGRVREPRRDPALTAALAGAAAAELGSARVDQIVLMRSQLSPRGARYTPLATLPLAASRKK